MKILIVDDDEQVLRYVSGALSEEGYDCTLAKDGREAMDLLSKEDFPVVLLDVLMPEADGVQVLNEMRKKHDQGGNEPRTVIAMSGGGATLPGWYAGNLMEMMGVQSVLYKPFSIDELLQQIRSSDAVQ